jgi:hypothetical protein
MIKWSNLTLVAFGIVIMFLVNGCEKKDELELAINEELSTGIRYDSLFLGVEFGFDRQEFFDHCWDLNKRELVMHGPENMSVQYLFKDSLEQTIAFNFYAEFDGDKDDIYQYNTSFYYYGWAPWNKHLQSDVLMEALPGILLNWHGGNKPFAKMVDGKKHYYKVDGNRLIDLFIMNERLVAAKYVDLSYYKSYGRN